MWKMCRRRKSASALQPCLARRNKKAPQSLRLRGINPTPEKGRRRHLYRFYALKSLFNLR